MWPGTAVWLTEKVTEVNSFLQIMECYLQKVVTAGPGMNTMSFQSHKRYIVLHIIPFSIESDMKKFSTNLLFLRGNFSLAVLIVPARLL